MSVKARLSSLKSRITRLPKPILFVTAFAIIGTILLITTRAAGPFASIEPESGVIAGAACAVSPTGASGSAVQFGGCPAGGALNLPRIPWEGGPAYWKKFPLADAAGMDEPTFFPINVFFGKPSHAAALKDIGVNMYQAAEHHDTLASITDLGILVMAQDEWTIAEIGNNPRVVGYHVSDECDMGYSGCDNGTTGVTAENYALEQQKSYVNNFRSRNDGRFLQANFGNGVLRTFWAPNKMSEHVRLMDASSVDKYTYTSPDVRNIIDGVHDAPNWPNGQPVDRAYSYGWLTDELRSFTDPAKPQPIWPFVESAKPYLTEEGAGTITTEQFEGAVWSSIIHEARGISIFQHNNGPVCGNYSLVDCDRARLDKIKATLAKVKSLAPIINTQSYVYNFNNQTDTMLKTYNGSAYIFAGIGMFETPGTKTFTLPAGINGTTVEVVGENRTILVTNRSFTDNFAAEYTHHVYKIIL